jgi:hypothetical protein
MILYLLQNNIFFFWGGGPIVRFSSVYRTLKNKVQTRNEEPIKDVTFCLLITSLFKVTLHTDKEPLTLRGNLCLKGTVGS